MVFLSALVESTVRGNKGHRGRDFKTLRQNKDGKYFYWGTGKRRVACEASHKSRMSENRAESEFTAIPLFCCSVFSADTVMETGSFFLFFIGRMPFHYDLWMQTLCRLILLSMHYVAQPSMAIWGREESPPTPATHTVSKALSPSVDSFLLLCVSLFASFPLQHKAS